VNVDPYAQPDAPGPGSLGSLPVGPPQPWTASEAISLALERFKDNWPLLVVANLVATFLSTVVEQVPAVLKLAHVLNGRSLAYALVYLACAFAGVAISTFFQVGLIRIFLAIARGQPAEFGTLFSGSDRFLPLLGVTVLMVLSVGLGFLLFIVPGVILGLGLFASMYYVVDAEMAPVDALRASWEATRGQKGEILLLGLIGLGLGLLGLLTCCVGLLATVPLYSLAMAIAFTRISGRGPAQSSAGRAAAPM
jgi:uncharacterized membrane protein